MNRQVNLKYKSHKIYNGKYSLNGLPALFDHKGNTQTLEILMQDDVIGLEVRLLYGVFEKEDVITRSVIIKNHSKENVQIDKILSANLDFSYGDFDIINFTGRHTMERQMQRSQVRQGIYQIGSIRGTSVISRIRLEFFAREMHQKHMEIVMDSHFYIVETL